MTHTPEALAACKAMRLADLRTLAETAKTWPNVSREQEHRTLDACDRLAILLDVHPHEVWAAAGFADPETRRRMRALRVAEG